MSEFPYEESYGPAYNYEVGYLEGLTEALRYALNRQDKVLVDILRGKIKAQKDAVMMEMPDDE